MDYGASIHDEQNPAEASPWGNSPQSSPRHNRAAFNQGAAAPPLSSFPSEISSNGLGGEHDDGGFGGGEPTYTRPDTADSTVSAAESSQPDETQYIQAPQQQQPQHDLPPPSPADQAHSQRGQEQPHARRQPVFKLQAKITGLERTGRKDPILRFDVHVRQKAVSKAIL